MPSRRIAFLRQPPAGGQAAGCLLVGAAIIVSWRVVHTVHMLRYARAYYAQPTGGIEFNEEDAPAYLDFAYFAFTIGMTFQVSDTNVTRKGIRH